MSDAKTVVMDVAVEKIMVAPNPRGKTDTGAMKELVESVGRNGILQPLVCRPSDGGGLMLVAGTRRLFAVKEAGLKTVPVTVRQGLTQDEILDIQLDENLQREDLDPIDEGKYLAEYRGKCTIEELAKRIGKSPKHITQRIALVDRLLPSFQKMVKGGTLSIGRAQVLAALSASDQEQLNPARKGLEFWEREKIEEMIERGSTDQFHEKVTEALHRIAVRPWKKAKAVKGKDGKHLTSCDECMTRSDRQGFLIPDGGDAKDACCLNTYCWDTHFAAWNDSQIAKLNAEGRRILTEAEIANVARSYERGKDKYIDFGQMDGRDLPCEIGREKFQSKCRACGNLGFYIGGDRSERNREVKMACLDKACFEKRTPRSSSPAPRSTQAAAFTNVDLKGSAQVFATAAWAMARALEIDMHDGSDWKASAAAVLVLSTQVHVDSKESRARSWILEAGGCEHSTCMKYASLLMVPATKLDFTARALAYFLSVDGNMYDGKYGDITGDLTKIMPKARKLFSPSNKHFLETLLRASVQAVGRHYKVKGIGGKRDDAVKAVAAAKLASEAKMPKAIEECFAGKKVAKK